jgi:uncharacterized membrane protein YkoI
MRVRLLSMLTITILLAISPLYSAETRENRRLKAGKITKNQAQHLVLKEYPGAHIKSCELKQVHGQSVWLVSFHKSNDKTLTTVRVDGNTGKILP